MRWSVAEAKQKFSEVLRASGEEPQLIFNRDRMVAAVLDRAMYEAFLEWKREQRQSIAEATEAIRKVAAEQGWESPSPPRRDRPNAFTEMLNQFDRERGSGADGSL